MIDTNIISEARKGARANKGVVAFFRDVADSGDLIYLSAVSIGELNRGAELIQRRGDVEGARSLQAWLTNLIDEFGDRILSFDVDAAMVWGRLTVPNPEHALDKQIAAIALVNDLTVVTRNVADFAGSGVRLRNPFV